MYRITNFFFLSAGLLFATSCSETNTISSENSEVDTTSIDSSITEEEYQTPPFYLLMDTAVEFDISSMKFDKTYENRDARVFADIVEVRAKPGVNGTVLGAIPFNELVEIKGRVEVNGEGYLFVHNRVINGYVNEEEISVDGKYTDFLIGKPNRDDHKIVVKTFPKNARNMASVSVFVFDSYKTNEDGNIIFHKDNSNTNYVWDKESGQPKLSQE